MYLKIGWLALVFQDLRVMVCPNIVLLRLAGFSQGLGAMDRRLTPHPKHHYGDTLDMLGLAVLGWFIFFLLLLQLKHFLIDFVLQSHFMTALPEGKRWFISLLMHALSHGFGSFTVLVIPAYVIGQVAAAAVVCVAEVVIHLVIDTVRLRLFFYNVLQPRYWTIHGIDQLLHGYTYIAMVAALCYLSFPTIAGPSV
jgi:hypothetical protein